VPVFNSEAVCGVMVCWLLVRYNYQDSFWHTDSCQGYNGGNTSVKIWAPEAWGERIMAQLDYLDTMAEITLWLIDVHQERISAAREALATIEGTLGGIGIENPTAPLSPSGALPDAGPADRPAPHRALAQLTHELSRLDDELQERREILLTLGDVAYGQAGEYALVAANNVLEAVQLLGLAQSTLANVLVSLTMPKRDVYQIQQKLYGVRLYLERIESMLSWAIEATTNGIRHYEPGVGEL
jgi:hypothetical protein